MVQFEISELVPTSTAQCSSHERIKNSLPALAYRNRDDWNSWLHHPRDITGYDVRFRNAVIHFKSFQIRPEIDENYCGG